MKREFYLRSDQSNKFWTVEVDGCDVVSANGRIGAKPRETRHSYADPAAAQAQADKDVAAKLKKGYVEGALDALPAYAPPDWANLPMNEDTFWRVIALVNWKHTGDDDAVLARAAWTAVTAEDYAALDEVCELAEALLFASRAGADPARVREALLGGFASSKILEVHAERMIKRTFDPGFRIALHQKDLNLALSSARQLGVSLPNTAQAQELFNSCVAHGGAAWDHSGMVRALEKMANFEVGQKAPA